MVTAREHDKYHAKSNGNNLITAKDIFSYQRKALK